MMRYFSVNLINILILLTFCNRITAVTNLKNAVGCEHNSVELQCENNRVINVLDANYGRTTEVTCSQKSAQNVTCYAEQSTAIVSDACEGKQHCKIEASNEVFGDPCRGTVKYLFVLYECVALTEFKTALSCELHTAELDCEAGKVIHVMDANYGRKSQLTCKDGAIRTTNCKSDNSLDVVTKKCENKRRCKIEASNDVFGDPCVNTYKYLQIKYKCKPKSECVETESDISIDGFRCNDGTTIRESLVCDGRRDCPEGDDELSCEYETKHACEGEKMKISCPKDEKIRIVNGNYGRLSKKVCPVKNGRTGDLECKSNKALSHLKDKCENKNNCEIEASNGRFGDPCYGIQKYAEVQYYCDRGPNSKHAIDPRSIKYF